MSELTITVEPIGRLVTYRNNAKIHTAEQIEQIKNSIKEFGFNDPIAVWTNQEGKSEIVEGHGRLTAAIELNIDKVPVIHLDHLTDEQRRAYTHVHNQLTMNTGFDFETLEFDLAELCDEFNFEDFGFELGFQENFDNSTTFDFDGEHGKLSDRFVVPPFSIIDTKGGDWKARKKYWNEIIDDDAERGTSNAFGGCMQGFGKKNSLLDPVLAEVLLKWFTPTQHSKVFDCFSGDTAFGFVSSFLGHDFTGIELREEQVRDNSMRCSKAGLNPVYICDDGRNVLNHIEKKSQDMFFSCPPYFNIEVYSDNKNDASNQETFDDFYAILDEAFSKSLQALKDNRFAVVVATDIRSSSGGYYDFFERVRDTFERNGAVLYNNIILATPLGSSALRANKFMKSRKTVRVHQNVMVFFKGDTKTIKDIFPVIEEDWDEYAGEDE